MTSNTPSAGSFEARPPAVPADRERTAAEIEAEIEQTRQRLAGTVDAIADRVKPANVARRGVDTAKAQVLDERGQVRPERLAVVAAAAALIGLLVWRRRR
jgi:Protein of unknown function (DUF3618)